MKAPQSLAERLQWARKQAKLTQAQVAERVGISQSSYCWLERGTALGSKFLASIARELGVNALWLESGDGKPYGDHVREDPAYYLPPRQRQILALVGAMSERKQAALITLLGAE